MISVDETIYLFCVRCVTVKRNEGMCVHINICKRTASDSRCLLAMANPHCTCSLPLLQQAISVPDFREAMDKYLRKRITQLASGDRMAKVMKDLMFRHLGWLVVSGSVMGCFIGLLAQALRLTVDPVFS